MLHVARYHHVKHLESIVILMATLVVHTKYESLRISGEGGPFSTISYSAYRWSDQNIDEQSQRYFSIPHSSKLRHSLKLIE